ncbi:hypothetical protein PUMCH_003884 [Australozyma saopauloensis]|uniref:Uncharacterized protein n=1 Tax=Australozyma saopauloensis TaxID=291208 RepID=A0AAX4HDL9_9ASCO|nr:hypothetical protein PUMCH_003884 [[Candida] saopauloensis]
MSSAEIFPGEGLSNFIALGELLYNSIKTLKEMGQPLQIAYSAKKYLETPILVSLPNLGVRLMFSSTGHQKLLLVEILNFEFLKLKYKGSYLNDIIFAEPSDDELARLDSSESLRDYQKRKQVLKPTLKEVYNRIFGPTFPGVLDKNTRTYLLSYPGVAFKFNLGLDELLDQLCEDENKNDLLAKLTNWHRPSDIQCMAVAIFKGDNYENFTSQLIQRAHSNEDSKKLGDATELSIEKLEVTLSTGTAEIHFHSHNKTPSAIIEIGKSTQQDILRILGPPDAYFNKFDSRLLIHKHLSSSTASDLDSGSVYKFHNYFRHGIDFLYKLNPPNQKGGVLQKIILHNGGIVKTLEFMQWNKCNWVVKTRPEHDAPSVDSSMAFHQYREDFLNEVNTEKSEPVLLNRNEIEFSKNEELEVVLSDELQQNVTLAAENSVDYGENKTLGQLKLYGYDRCIWEVVENNGCVSCAIIY